jgi:enoyl-CoA hydratase/carnithine racemase
MSPEAADPTAGSVELTRTGPVAVLTLSRPQAHNALTWTMYDQLDAHLAALAADDTARVVVLRGAGGRAFAAGTDINQFRDFGGEDGIRYEERIDAIVGRLVRLPKPTIAAIEGYAVGGGFGLAAACDLRYANTRAKLGVPVAKTLGNCLSLNNYRRLAGLLGEMKVKELLYTGRLMDAEEGLRVGFLTAVFPDDEFGARVEGIAQEIAGNAPLTLWATKTALLRLEEAAAAAARAVPFDDVIRRVYGSEDFHQAVLARQTKTAPVWRGR